MNDHIEAWIADPDDPDYPDAPTLKLIDLNALEADAIEGFGLVDEPDFDSETYSAVEIISPGTDGGALSALWDRTRNVSLPVWYRTSSPGIPPEIRDLHSAVDRYGVLGLKLPGAEAIFYDYEVSPIGMLFRGQERGLFKIVRLLKDPDGYPLRFNCMPWPRTATITAPEPHQVTNEVGDRHFFTENPGNKPGELGLRFQPTDGLLGLVRIAIRDRGNLTRWAELYSQGSSDWTLGADTTLETVTGASGGEAAVCDFDDKETRAMRARGVRDFTDDPTALAGRHTLKLRLKEIDRTSDGFEGWVLPRYGFADTEVALNTLPRVYLDFSNVTANPWVEIELGEVVVPPGAGKLIVEIWAARQEGDASLAFDQTILEPSDTYRANVYVPGMLGGEWGRSRFFANELSGTGVLKGDVFRVRGAGEYAETEEQSLPAGRYFFRPRVRLRNPGSGAIEVCKVEVLDDEDTVVASLKLKSRRNRLWTLRRPRLYFAVSPSDVTAERTYRCRVTYSASDLAGRRGEVAWITLRSIYAVSASEQGIIEGLVPGQRARLSFVESATTTDFPLILDNQAPMLPPGNVGVLVSSYDIIQDPGYGEVDERAPLGRSVLTRTTVIEDTVTPRWTH